MTQGILTGDMRRWKLMNSWRNRMIRRLPGLLGHSLLAKLRSVPKLPAFLIAGAAVCIVVAIASDRAVQCPVRGKLTRFGNIALRYDTAQDSGISPLCGCAEELKAEEWRGVTFFGQQAKLRRSGGLPLTYYLLSGAYPGKSVWNPPDYHDSFLSEGIVWVLEVPADVEFNPRALNTSLPENYKIIRRVEFDGEKYLSLVTAQDLNIELLGPTPLVAWIPAKDSEVSITETHGMFSTSPTLIDVVEEYRSWPVRKDPDKDYTAKPNRHLVEYPLGDFLGPDVVFWTDDPKAVATAAKGISFSGSAEEGYRVIIAVLISRAPWSVRLSCIPVDQGWMDDYLRLLPDLGGRVLSRPLDAPGQTQLTIKSNMSEADVAGMYRLMDEHQFVWINDIGGEVRDRGVEFGQRFNYEFRYPPLPARGGVNIFGPLASLRFTSAEGKLLARNHRIDIDVGSQVAFEGMRGLAPAKGVISVPVKTDVSSSDFQIESVRRLVVNGQTQNTVGTLFGISTAAEQLIVAAAIVQALCAVIALRRG